MQPDPLCRVGRGFTFPLSRSASGSRRPAADTPAGSHEAISRPSTHGRLRRSSQAERCGGVLRQGRCHRNAVEVQATGLAPVPEASPASPLITPHSGPVRSRRGAGAASRCVLGRCPPHEPPGGARGPATRLRAGLWSSSAGCAGPPACSQTGPPGGFRRAPGLYAAPGPLQFLAPPPMPWFPGGPAP